MSKHKVFWDLLTDALLLFHIHLRHWSLSGINEHHLQRGITSSHVGRKQFPRLDPPINAKLIPGIYSSLWVGLTPLSFPKDHYIRDVGEDPDWNYWSHIKVEGPWAGFPAQLRTAGTTDTKDATETHSPASSSHPHCSGWGCLAVCVLLQFFNLFSKLVSPAKDIPWLQGVLVGPALSWLVAQEGWSSFTHSWDHKMVSFLPMATPVQFPAVTGEESGSLLSTQLHFNWMKLCHSNPAILSLNSSPALK